MRRITASPGLYPRLFASCRDFRTLPTLSTISPGRRQFALLVVEEILCLGDRRIVFRGKWINARQENVVLNQRGRLIVAS